MPDGRFAESGSATIFFSGGAAARIPMQPAWSPTALQLSVVPLDNRHSYTKSYWETWTATTCSARTRRRFGNALAYRLNGTSTDKSFTDLYETIDTGSCPASLRLIYLDAWFVAGVHFSLRAMVTRDKPGGGN